MSEFNRENYIFDQAKIEIEHTRSWPTKVMAFFVAIHFGIVGTVIGLQKTNGNFLNFPCAVKTILTLFIVIFSGWVICILLKNHVNYLIYRNIQIRLQRKNLEQCRKEFDLPDDWFRENFINWFTRSLGWGLYGFLVIGLCASAITVIWLLG